MPLRHAENHHPEEQFRVDVYLLPVQTQLVILWTVAQIVMLYPKLIIGLHVNAPQYERDDCVSRDAPRVCIAVAVSKGSQAPAGELRAFCSVPLPPPI